VLAVRAWALLGPVLVFAAVVRAGRRSERSEPGQRDRDYRSFWHDVGATFPDLGGAASTTFYFENERRLVTAHLGTLADKRVLKTDLWDEARNTRILQWIQRQGAHVVGVDISLPVVHMAGLPAANADVRALPFREGSFDAVYSMGTIEHFAETDAAVREIFRVTRPGGRAVVGVPNRRDPFLRPLLVAVLYRLGLYGYGYEKSYSHTSLRRMLEDAGFVVAAADGILFMPGWLRMLDLLCHTRFPPAARLTGAGVRVFRWIDARMPSVRRHGYLIVAIGDRPS
jgi:SAM-dependent methyltransferase